MREIVGDIWQIREDICLANNRKVIVIPTNGSTKKNGEAVMGAGLAKQAAERFQDLPRVLGKRLRFYGNIPHEFSIPYRIVTFPTKVHWSYNADLELINKSALLLLANVQSFLFEEVYIPRLGCGNGKLSWTQVEPILRRILKNDQFIIVHKEDE